MFLDLTDLAADSANSTPPAWSGWIPAPFSNWSQVYTRPVLEGQDNGPGFGINNDSFLTWNGTQDGKGPPSPLFSTPKALGYSTRQSWRDAADGAADL